MASKIVSNNIDFVMKDKRALAGVLDLNKTKWKASPHSRIYLVNLTTARNYP